MKIKNELQQLDKADLIRVLWYARFKTVLHKIRQLHPVQIAVPVVVLQIVTFSIFVTNSVLHLAIANLIIVGIALLPFALHKSKPKYHWVKAND